MALGPVESHAIAVRDLVKAVFGGYRANFYWLKEYVVARISGHMGVFPGVTFVAGGSVEFPE
jgi:hypothetical protein